jgi:hypothetical protein
MDIVVWLRSLGLGTNEAAFREKEIKNYDEKHRSRRLTSSPGRHERWSTGARHARWPKWCRWAVSTPPTAAAAVARTGSQANSAGCSTAHAPTVESHAR